MFHQGHHPSRQLAAMHLSMDSSNEWLTDLAPLIIARMMSTIFKFGLLMVVCMVGDGSGLHISSIGSQIGDSHSCFKLNDILHVPSISRNLLLVLNLQKAIIVTLNFTLLILWLGSQIQESPLPRTNQQRNLPIEVTNKEACSHLWRSSSAFFHQQIIFYSLAQSVCPSCY